MSAFYNADQAALLGWLRSFRHPPGQTFVVHGEPEAAGALATALRRDFGWPGVEVPAYGSEWRLSGL